MFNHGECDIPRHDQDLSEGFKDEYGQFLDNWANVDPFAEDPFTALEDPELPNDDVDSDDVEAPFGLVDFDGGEITTPAPRPDAHSTSSAVACAKGTLAAHQ